LLLSYWFGGKQLLERPFEEVLRSGEPDFPFCLCWANQTDGDLARAPNRVLIEQTYPGRDDHVRHFEKVLPAFLDRRYLKVDGKPLFLVYNPVDLPDSPRVMELWRSLASRAGLPGLFLVAEHPAQDWDPGPHGYDAAVTIRLPERRRGWVPWSHPVRKIKGKLEQWRGIPRVHPYERVIDGMIADPVPGIENFPA
jgi:hypothetical protein